MPRVTLIAAADGSALGNPGPAGWAWYIDDDHWASGGWPHGTNNMGELTAVLDLLQQTAATDDDLLVYCDSLYAINSITKWMPGWKRKGWRKGDGKPVLNVEIMKALDARHAGSPSPVRVGQGACRPRSERGGRPVGQRRRGRLQEGRPTRRRTRLRRTDQRPGPGRCRPAGATAPDDLFTSLMSGPRPRCRPTRNG